RGEGRRERAGPGAGPPVRAPCHRLRPAPVVGRLLERRDADRAPSAAGRAAVRPPAAAGPRPRAGAARRAPAGGPRRRARPRGPAGPGGGSRCGTMGVRSERLRSSMSHTDELEEYDAELELRLKREYADVFPLFRFCVLTQE